VPSTRADGGASVAKAHGAGADVRSNLVSSDFLRESQWQAASAATVDALSGCAELHNSGDTAAAVASRSDEYPISGE
jgi:hypothetical protein